jgi:cell division transport system ATP-binding protein
MALDTIIEFDQATISQHDHLVLKDVTIKIDRGEFVYLIGKVGSGKSSFIKTINAELPLTSGTASVVEFELHKLKKRQIPYLRRKLGVVFQDFQLLQDRSVIQNLAFVLKATGWTGKTEIDQRITDVLQKVDLVNKGFKMPHQLSGGEQQRVVIARALLNDPDVILADEPTGNLDPDTSADIMKLLIEISRTGRAVLMATHNYSFLKKFPARIVKCENGTLVESEQNEEIDFESLME